MPPVVINETGAALDLDISIAQETDCPPLVDSTASQAFADEERVHLVEHQVHSLPFPGLSQEAVHEQLQDQDPVCGVARVVVSQKVFFVSWEIEKEALLEVRSRLLREDRELEINRADEVGLVFVEVFGDEVGLFGTAGTQIF